MSDDTSEPIVLRLRTPEEHVEYLQAKFTESMAREAALRAEVKKLTRKHGTEHPGWCSEALKRAERAEARLAKMVEQKTALIAARVAVTENLGQAVTVLYRESAKSKPSRETLRAEAKRLDAFLLGHRTITAMKGGFFANWI